MVTGSETLTHDGDIIGVDEYATDREDFTLSGKELNALLPQVFTRSGTVRKDTRRNMRGLDNVITALKLAERARSDDKKKINSIIRIDVPCGHILLCDELADHIRATDLWSALATKGWYISIDE